MKILGWILFGVGAVSMALAAAMIWAMVGPMEGHGTDWAEVVPNLIALLIFTLFVAQIGGVLLVAGLLSVIASRLPRPSDSQRSTSVR